MPPKKLKFPNPEGELDKAVKKEEERMDTDNPPHPLLTDSPVTSLSGTLSRLSTRQTPKRNLSLDDSDTPTNSSSFTGVFLDSPTPIESPTFDRGHLKKFNSTPEFQRFGKQDSASRRDGQGDEARASTSGVAAIDENSSDSMFNLQAFVDENQGSQDSNSQGADFKMPPPVASQKRPVSEDSCLPRRKSFKRALCFANMDPNEGKDKDGVTPAKIRRSAAMIGHQENLEQLLKAQCQKKLPPNNSKDLAILVGEAMDTSSAAPYEEKDDDTPVRKYREAKRNMQLHRSQSMVVASRPLQEKQEQPVPQQLSPRSLHRSHSASEAFIKEAVHKMSEEPNLIADSSKLCLLPTISGKHQDLKTISCQTMVHLLNGRYAGEIENYHIVDCRFPYEYEGGHIKNAINIYKTNMLTEKYIKNPVKTEDPTKRFFLIFHCEFSSERGPNLYRHLRTIDRQLNSDRYPRLFYPEMYLLEGGYSAFFVFHKELCEPQNYIPMLHKDYSKELAMYQVDKKKCGDKKKRGTRSLDAGGSGRVASASRSLNL